MSKHVTLLSLHWEEWKLLGMLIHSNWSTVRMKQILRASEPEKWKMEWNLSTVENEAFLWEFFIKQFILPSSFWRFSPFLRTLNTLSLQDCFIALLVAIVTKTILMKSILYHLLLNWIWAHSFFFFFLPNAKQFSFCAKSHSVVNKLKGFFQQ